MLAVVALAGMPDASWGAQPVAGRDYYSVQLRSTRTSAVLQESLALVADQPYARIDKRGELYALRVGFWESREEAEQAARALLPKFRDAYARIASYRPDAIVATAGEQTPKSSTPLPSTDAPTQEIEKPIAAMAAPAPVQEAAAVEKAVAGLAKLDLGYRRELLGKIREYRKQLDAGSKNEAARQGLAEIAVAYAGQIEAAEVLGEDGLVEALSGRVRNDLADTRRRLDQMAKRGDRGAQAALGLLYRRGIAVGKDEQKACHYYHLASEQGDVAAMYHYGLCVASQDKESSDRLLLRAANEGHPGAQARLKRPEENPQVARAEVEPEPVAAPAPAPTAPEQAAPVAQDALPAPAQEIPPIPTTPTPEVPPVADRRTPPAPPQTTSPPTSQTFLPASTATSLVLAFRAAKDFDAQYRGALAEKSFNDSASTASQLAYTPQLQYSQQQYDYANASRSTWTITQPVVSGDRFFSYRQAGPRALLADSTLAQRDQDLAQRLLRSVTEFVRAREAIRALENQIGLLKEQASQAQRMFDLGRGTIIDVRDTAVRHAQASASRLAALTRLRVAENQFAAITGSPPAKGAFAIAEVPRRFDLETEARYTRDGQSNNPQITVARQNERIAELEAQRAKAALLPTLSAIGVQTESAGISNRFAGVAVSFPLQGQTVVQISSARAQAERAREQRRQTEQGVQLDIERLRALVESGQQELTIRKEAIGAGELALRANLMGQQAGVRTSVDVLNSIQTLANVRNDYANTAATLAENYLSLLLQSAYETNEALARIQQVLFGG